MKQNCRCILIVLVPLLGISHTENGNRLKDVLKNSTYTANNQTENYKDDVLKAEVVKIMQQCGGEYSQNYKPMQYYEMNTNTGGNNYSSNFNYSNYHDSQDNLKDIYDGTKNNNFNTKYDYTMNKRYRNNKNPYNYRSNDDYNADIFENSHSFRNKNYDNPNENRGQFNFNNDDYDNERNNHYNLYGNKKFGNNNHSATDFNRHLFGIRTRRNEKENDSQCISQCIFGHMELLDENRVPSETLVIKWLQDHIANNDLKRIKTLREIRRCFAKLSTYDSEDGCEFSRQLSKCMDLDVE